MEAKARHKHGAFFVIALAVLLLTAGVWHFVALTRADPPPVQYDVTITATVLGCGDGIIQLGEDCDGSNMDGHTCITESFVSGSISCSASCTLNTSSCSMTAASGGGTANNIVTVSSTNEVFTGQTSPGATVTVFKDGQVVAMVTADATGVYFAQINNLTNGTYTFGFKATDPTGNSSSLSTVTLTANGGTVTTADIFLSPTIPPILTQINTGDVLTISGQSAPGALVTLTLFSPSGAVILSQQVTADASGLYSGIFDTSSLTTAGTYSITAIAGFNSLMSALSLPLSFDIGAIEKPTPDGDVNNDGFINLIDFSIALYWYKESFSPSAAAFEYEHLNGDGVLNLVDISIIAYFWTG